MAPSSSPAPSPRPRLVEMTTQDLRHLASTGEPLPPVGEAAEALRRYAKIDAAAAWATIAPIYSAVSHGGQL